MQDRPSIDELLEAVAGFLHEDVMVNTTGRLSFHARVAGNVVQMLRRELQHEEEHLTQEWTSLNATLGEHLAPPASLTDARAALLARNEALAAHVRAGDFDRVPARAGLLAHLRTVTHAKLVVSNPALAGEG